VAQDGAQPYGEGQPFFSLTGIWVTPSSWYSTGSSMVMSFSSGCDLGEDAYRVVVLPSPWSGHQNMP